MRFATDNINVEDDSGPVRYMQTAALEVTAIPFRNIKIWISSTVLLFTLQVLPEWMETVKMYDIYGGKGVEGSPVLIKEEKQKKKEDFRNGEMCSLCETKISCQLFCNCPANQIAVFIEAGKALFDFLI